MPKVQKTKFTLHMGKKDATRSNILSDKTNDKIQNGQIAKLAHQDPKYKNYDGYFLTSQMDQPKWMKKIAGAFKLPNYTTNSPAALVIFETKGRVFVLTFGYASMLLSDYNVEV